MPRDVSKYQVDGRRVPSVTEVIDLAGLVDWSRVPADVLETARERGSAVHEWIELLVKHPDDVRGIDPPEVVAPYVAAWEAFMADSGFEIELAEEAVVSKLNRYAGTFDALGKLDGRPTLIDWKARAGLTPEIGPQTAGYALALVERGVAVGARYALLLQRDGSYRLRPHLDRQDTHDFLAAVRVAHFKLRAGLATLEERGR